LSTPVESGEDDIPDDDSEEEREVCPTFCFAAFSNSIFSSKLSCLIAFLCRPGSPQLTWLFVRFV